MTSSEISPVETSDAPGPTGGDAPYSQAIVYGGLVFVAGQLPVLPESGLLAAQSIRGQTTQVMHNLQAVLEAAGSSLTRLIRTTVYIRNRDDWAEMNDIYKEFIGPVPPARTCLEVGRMAHGALIELDAIAHV